MSLHPKQKTFTAITANLSKKIDGDVRSIFARQNIVIVYFVLTFRLVTGQR